MLDSLHIKLDNFSKECESSNIGLVVYDSLPANANTIFGTFSAVGLFLGHFVPWDVFWDVLCCGTFSAWDVLRVGCFESGTF